MKIEVDVENAGLRLNIDGGVLIAEDKYSKTIIQLNLSETNIRVLKQRFNEWKG